MPKTTSAEEAVKHIKSGDTVFIHSVSAAPHHLIDAMMQRSDELRDVTIVHLHTEGPAPYADPKFEENFQLHSFFLGSNARKATWEGVADYIPVFLSEVPKLMREGVIHIDVALMMVSPPDKHNYVSLGGSVDASMAAVEVADTVIAQVNSHVPRSLGDGCMHIHHFDYFVPFDSPLPETIVPPPSQEEQRIGDYIAEMVDDGATLQMGIGAIPNAVLANLSNHKDLGIHTEMFTDGLIPLVEKGVVTNEKKKIWKYHVVSSFVMGSQKVFDFINDNPRVAMMDCAFVNDVAIIRKNPKVTAINSAIEIDITGQVCADSIGTRHFSGVGGQIDFIRGASYSDGGKPIIAMTSRTGKGISKIVPTLKEGAGVVTTRANIHYVVTEYGVADLYGKPLKERARRLIEIAHPDDREALSKAAFDRWNGHYQTKYLLSEA